MQSILAPTRRRRGAMFLSSLFIALLVLMLIGSTYQLLGTRIHQADNLEASERARFAAEAGTRYALAQLQKNPTWKGDGNATIVDQPGLVIVEDRGNVLGFVSGLQGQVSQFRVRFNFQNGTSSTPDEGLDDPVTYPSDSPFVSINNLRNSTPTPAYRAIPSGGSMRVLSASPQPYTVPRFACTFLVEGLSGDALRDTSPTQPQPVANRASLSRVVLETTVVRANLSNVDAALYSAGDTEISVDPSGGVVNVTSNDGSAPRIRSLANITVNASDTDAYETGPNGKVHIGNPGSFTVAGGVSTSAAGAGTAETRAKQVKKWPKIKWSEVQHAAVTGDVMPAGTYVWRDAPPRLEYYEQEYAGVIPTAAPR